MQGRIPLGLGVALIALLLDLAGVASAASVTVDGAQTYQTIEGFGANANHRSWNNNELPPVLDALIDQAGLTLFRVIFDKTDWEASNDNGDPNVLNWDSYNQIYTNSDFQKQWDMAAYLNQKGISNGLMFNFQGVGPAWMGSNTLTAGLEAEWAEMIASVLIYARNTQHLQFALASPGNENDNNPPQGIVMTSSQYVTALRKIAQLLDANGLSDLRFVGPDLAHTSSNRLSGMLGDPVVMAKLAHFGLHSYEDNGGGSAGIYDFLQQSAYPDRTFWMTEYNFWCSPCEQGSGGDNTWLYARTSLSYLLYHLANGTSAGLIWEAYDSQYNYYNPGQWSYWGLLGVDNIHATPKTYTPRKTFYALAQVAKFVRPGARRIRLSGSTSPFQVLAFHHPGTGQLVITGINPDAASRSLSGVLTNLPAVTNLALYHTSSSANLSHSATFPVTGGSFAATIPADCVFTLVHVLAPRPTLQIRLSSTNILLSWPAASTNYFLQAATNLLAANFWSPVTNTPQTVGDLRTVTLPPSPARRFFRLHLHVLAPGPTLQIRPSSTNILLSWPAALTNCFLEAATNLLPASTWSPVTNTPQTVGDLRTVALPAVPARRFFRLHQQ